MDILETYLLNLQNKVFKLLPMREAYDKGMKNHLEEYLNNLCANCAGSLECYPELSHMREVVEVQSNIAFLRSNISLDLSRWRGIVLRSTRLIHTALSNRAKKEG